MTALQRLSILDFGGRRWQRPSFTAIGETVRAVQLAEKLGYDRFWLAEHQSYGDAWGAAAVMIGHLAAKTSRIRVGAAGTLVMYHDAFDIAADYRFLEALHPGRIDLGIAGGGPSMRGLRPRRGDREYRTSVAELIELVRRRPQDLIPDETELIPLPADVIVPMPWVLGTGHRSKETAIEQRAAFCYSVFHSPRIDPAILAEYRDRFQPNEFADAPQASVCAVALCAETEAEAQAILARQAPALDARGATVNAIGSPRQCAEQLEAIADEYGVAEIVVHDVARTVPERRRCYELLAEAILGSSIATPAVA